MVDTLRNRAHERQADTVRSPVPALLTSKAVVRQARPD